MAVGVDRIISFDPPGAIGLVDLASIFVIRFDETDGTVRPQDDDRVCQDFDVLHGGPGVGLTSMPALVDAVVGRGRQFGAGRGLAALDAVPGNTLLTRDMSIQVVLTWDAVGQQSAGAPGVIIARGRGTAAAEFVCYGLRIDVVNAATGLGLVRWFWQDIAGVDHIDAGAQVTFPLGKYTMLTATRRWVSPTSVALSYYVGDQLAGQVPSAAGSIGGGTTGTMQLGYRYLAAIGMPATAGTTNTAAGGFGTWAAGWLCQDAATPLVAAYGGTNLPQAAAGGSPVYQVPGPFGDKAVRVTVPNTGWAAASAAFLDPSATMDICGVVVMRDLVPAGSTSAIVTKTDFAGGPGFEVSRNAGTITLNVDHTSPGNVTVTASVNHTLSSNEWFAVMFALDRAAGTMRIAYQSLASGVQVVGASVSASGLGSVSNAGAAFRVQDGGGLGSTVEYRAVYMGVGVGAAAGLPANLSAALSAFCTYIGGIVVQPLVGTLDELMILDRELCAEEIAATWLRVTYYQPLGVQLFREMFDEDFPLSQEPGSDAQLDIRMTGQALGFAAALIENMRSNFVPQRSFGTVLEDWEAAFQTVPQQTQGLSIPDRRARVLAKARQQSGSSTDGIKDILSGLLGGASLSQLQFLAFGNMASDDFSTGINALRWDVSPSASVTVSAGTVTLAASTNDVPVARGWRFLRRSVGGDAKQAHQIGKVHWQTSKPGTDSGVFFGDAGRNNYVLLGMRDAGVNYHVFLDSVVGGATVQSIDIGDTGISTGSVTPVWLHLYQTATDGTWAATWSLVSATAGFTNPVTIVHPTTAHWAGFHLRTTAGVSSSGIQSKVNDHVLWAPFSSSPFNAYVLLDRVLGFKPDVLGARSALAQIKHAFVHGMFITTPQLLFDDAENGFDQAPCGGY